MKKQKVDYLTNLFRQLHQIVDFQLDANGTERTTRLPRFCHNGIIESWEQRTWVQPPTRDLAKWLRKARVEANTGKTIVMLIPAAFSTKYFFDIIWRSHMDVTCLNDFGEFNGDVSLFLFKERLELKGEGHSVVPAALCCFNLDDEQKKKIKRINLEAVIR